MKKIVFLLTLFSIFSLQAQNVPTSPTGDPLRVAICRFSPPFIIEATQHQFHGFDIDLMNGICRLLNRECRFVPLPFVEIFTAVENNKVDVGVCAITITADRSQRVTLSTSYFPSQARFIGKPALANQPFSLELLTNKKIGVEDGSIFSTQIEAMGIKNPVIKPFATEDLEIEALGSGTIDLALMDAPTARYWQLASKDSMKFIGPPLSFGFGYGVALNRTNTDLINAVNAALQTYLISPSFKKSFSTYIQEF